MINSIMCENTIYVGISSKDWIDVVELLHEEHNFIPNYWICHGIDDTIEKNFEYTTIHDIFDAVQARFPDKYAGGPFHSSLDSEILSKFRECESVVLKMMDRMDAGNVTNANFTYPERIRHYHRQLSYWNHVVDDIEPDVVVFGSTPHLIYDYILYAICQQRNIETVIFTRTGLPSRFYVMKDINHYPTQFEEAQTTRSELPSEIVDHLQKLRGTYSQAKPEYMKKDTNKVELSDLFRNGYELGKSVGESLLEIPRLFDEKERVYRKVSGEEIEKSQMKFWEWRFYCIKARFYKRKLYRRYQECSIEPDYSSDYIYFPLHYQPESSTSPDGGQFSHQYLAVKLLASALHNGMSVYTKEHPSQFSARLIGDRGRQPNYYADLNAIPNVELVSVDSEPFELIDNSRAVATVTGTAGWEALVRGTPAITFGNAWYRGAPGCHYVKTRSQVENAVESVIQENTITNNDINDFISKVESVTYQGSRNSTVGNSLYKAVCENCTKIQLHGRTGI